jgi:outer membrane protein OmpA-like peptidoglycan-associated protein
MNRIGLILGILLAALPLLGQSQRNGGQRFEEERSRVVLRNLTRLNTEHLEFSPTYFKNGLVFVSSRKRGGYVDKDLNETYFDLFFTELEPDGSPGRIKPFSMELNSPWHEGPVTFTKDYKTVYFTRNNFNSGGAVTNKNGRVVLKIYKAEWGPYNDWANVQEMPFNGESFTTMHPTLHPDGQQLYFASDRPGGFGKNDIYMVEMINGKWSEPINLGPEINTAGNEVSPFFHESGYFFFASDGHPGEGSMDLYMVDMGGKRWGQLTNLGTPFNTPDDDFGFLMHPSGTRGYFSSNRQDGLGKDDIYLFTVPDGLGGVQVVTDVKSQIRVWDDRSRRTLEGVNVFVKETDSFGERIRTNPTDPSQTITIQEALDDPGLLGSPTFITGQRGSGSVQLDPERSYTIIFEKDGYETKQIGLYEGGMPPNIDVKLAAIECIRLQGILENVEGGVVGGAQVTIQNSCTGLAETVESAPNGKYEYCLEIGCSFTISAQKGGFMSASTAVSTEYLRGNRLFRANLRMKPSGEVRQKGATVERGSIFVLEQLTFERGSDRITPGREESVYALADLLQRYPSLEIEIGAHTDARGEASYNQRLSLRRAERIKRILVDRGISATRIIAFGYGGNQPQNHCAEGIPCSEEEHRENRRIEVKIRRGAEGLTADQLEGNLVKGRR